MSEAIELAQDMDSIHLAIINHNELARLQWQAGNPDASMRTLFKMAKMAQERGDISWEANAYANLATNHKMLEEYKKTLQYEKKALELYHSINDTLLIYNILYNLADTYYEVGNYDSANYYLISSDKFYKPGDATFEYVLQYINASKALIKARNKEYEEAEQIFESSAQNLEKYNDKNSLALYSIEFAKIFLSHGNYRKAIAYALEGYNVGIERDFKEVIQDGSQVLSEAFEKINKPDSSLYYYKTYHAYTDSIINIENVKTIESLRADFQVAQKQTEVDLLNQEKETRQILMIALGIIAILAAGFLVNFYLAYQKRKKLSQKLEALNTTKDKFFSIVSHDLRGPVSAFNGISTLIKGYLEQKAYDELEEVSEEISKSSNSLSELLDNLLSWAVQQQGNVPYNPSPIDLNEIISTTVQIFETTAKAKQISIENKIGRTLYIYADKDTTMTIFRNLVGNAFKFTSQGGKIWIEAETKDDQVQIMVRDTGIGMSREQIDELFQMREKRSYGTDGESGLGLGLQLVQEFVLLNKGSIKVESIEGEGSTFIVSFPVPQIKEIMKEMETA